MPWVKLDDEFYAHPKLAALGKLLLPCVGLHCMALSWSSHYLTDGYIPNGQVERLGGANKDADALVDAGLWEREEDAYRIHDFLEYNPSSAETEARRAQKARAGKLGGRRSGEVRRGSREPNGKQTANQTGGESEAGTTSEPIDEQTSEMHEQRPLGSDPEGRPNPTRTPVPEPAPVPVPVTRTTSSYEENPQSSDGGNVRSDVNALQQRLGRVTSKQRRVLDEIDSRHGESGREWSTSIIDETPSNEDPLAALMKADSAWQAERHAQNVAEEQAWARQKTEDRGTATRTLDDLGWTGFIKERRRTQDATGG